MFLTVSKCHLHPPMNDASKRQVWLILKFKGSIKQFSALNRFSKTIVHSAKWLSLLTTAPLIVLHRTRFNFQIECGGVSWKGTPIQAKLTRPASKFSRSLVKVQKRKQCQIVLKMDPTFKQKFMKRNLHPKKMLKDSSSLLNCYCKITQDSTTRFNLIPVLRWMSYTS